MNKKFMPGMIMLDSTITPGRSTDFDYGTGVIGDSYYDPELDLDFVYRDGDSGFGWYGADDETFFQDIQEGWIHLV